MKHLFGTDGIRTRVGTEPFTYTHLPKLARAIAYWISQRYGALATPHVAIGTDTRESCFWIKATIKQSLHTIPCFIYDVGVIPTPCMQFIIEAHHIDIGIIISASHNPYHDNGIKIIKRGQKIGMDDRNFINEVYYKETNLPEENQALEIAQKHMNISAYIDHFLQIFEKKFLSGIHILLDCAHGAYSSFAPSIFSLFGARVTSLYNQPNGKNINRLCGSTYPQALVRAMTLYKADIGFAFDGDGDRVIIVTKQGQIKDGDDILACLVHHPQYAHTKNVIGTIMTNEGLVNYLQQFHKTLIRVPVGDTHVTQHLIACEALVGGEQSGHIIMKDHLCMSDGVFTALRVLETIRITHNWDLHTFEKHPQLLINIPIQSKISLDSPVIQDIINTIMLQLPYGRIVIRYSGTESLLRVMIEDKDKEHAHFLSAQLISLLQQVLDF